MAPSNMSHRQTHNLLLISKLLSLRDTASPLTLLLDSLEQPATPLIKEYIRRARLSKVHVTLIAFEALKPYEGVDAFVTARRKSATEILKEVAAAYKPDSSSGSTNRRRLILIDSINPLLHSTRLDNKFQLSTFLSSFIVPSGSPTARIDSSLVINFHQDVPGRPAPSPYTPAPLTILTYLATTVIKLHSFSHILAQKAARDRSLVPPVFGLAEEQDGVLLGRLDKPIGKNSAEGGIVLEMEYRRKSGRGVLEWYLLPLASSYSATQAKEVVTLVDDHPLYRPPEPIGGGDAEEEPESTFELGLTERQRREREGVVLPYFDAQQGDGPGEGGRILYDMGEEDDFDEEEDEI
ncbi:Elongator complex protein 5 [Aspergillus heterothallicus]